MELDFHFCWVKQVVYTKTNEAMVKYLLQEFKLEKTNYVFLWQNNINIILLQYLNLLQYNLNNNSIIASALATKTYFHFPNKNLKFNFLTKF